MKLMASHFNRRWSIRQLTGIDRYLRNMTPCPCSPVARPLGRHVQYSVTRAVCRWWLDCSLLGAIGNALYESSGRSLHRPTYAYYQNYSLTNLQQYCYITNLT